MKFNVGLKLEHFEAGLRDVCREVLCHRDDPTFPSGRETNKGWEIASCIRALRELDVLRPDAEVLGVAAGCEHTGYWLTNHVRRVYMTDLYGNGTWRESPANMLTDPAAFAEPGKAWNPRRLVVQHMNALDLLYEDESFDGVFSCGSIEHFGSLLDVARAAREIGRVLKPGGVAVIATELRIDGPADRVGFPGVIVFTPEMLLNYVVEPSGLQLVDEPDWATDAETASGAYPLVEAVEQGLRTRSVALTHHGFTWTSGLVVLRKP